MDQTLPATLTQIDKLKIYAIEVLIQKVGPAALSSVVSLITAFLLAHQGRLESFGINYIPEWTPDWLLTHAISGKIILIELDTTSIAMLSVVGALAVASILGTGHHVGSFITGKPQFGGQRADDQ